MLESLSDYISLASIVLALVVGLYYFILLFNMHYMDRVKKREDRYYEFYENAYEDDNSSDDIYI